MSTCSDCGFENGIVCDPRRGPCGFASTEARAAELIVENSALRRTNTRLRDEVDSTDRLLTTALDTAADRLRKINAAVEELENAECVGLDEENRTCQTQPEWRDNPGKWCHVCSALRLLGARSVLYETEEKNDGGDARLSDV
jgi:hypothetical protein